MTETESLQVSIDRMEKKFEAIPLIEIGNPMNDGTLEIFQGAYVKLKELQIKYSKDDSWTQPPIVLMQDSGIISGLLATVAEVVGYYVAAASVSEDFRLVYEAYLRSKYYSEMKSERELEENPTKKARFTDQEIKALARERLAEFMEKHGWKLVGAEAMVKCVKASELLCQRLKDFAVMMQDMGDKGDM